MPTVRLTWTDPNSGPTQEEEVRIYRDTAAFTAGSLPAVLATLAADTLTYDDTTVVDGNSYYYAVAFERGGFLALSFTGEVEVGVAASQYQISIGAGEVGSTVTNFPVMVDLSLMPSSFWTEVNDDGGNIRAYASTGGAQYALDIASFHQNAQDGTLWVKVPSITNGAGATFILELGDPTQQREARGATYGSAAVWTDYQSVFLGGENTDDRASTSRLFTIAGDCVSFVNVGNPEMTFAADPHQGVTWHEASGEVYTSDDNALRRYSAAGTLLTSNTNPNADIMTATGLTGLVHLGDLCVVGDFLIVPANDFPTDSKCVIAVFDRVTLTLVNTFNATSIEPAISGICWNLETERLVTCNWGSFTRLYRFTLNQSTGAIAADGNILLNRLIAGGNFNNAAQGIEYWRGHYWISDDTRDEVVRVKPNGDYHPDDSPIQYADDNGASVAGNYEGICIYKDGLAVLIDPSAANSYIIYSRPANFDFGGGGARYGTSDGYFESTGLTGGTTFTMSISAARSATKQQSILTFRDFSSDFTNDRVTLAHRFVTPNYRLEVWDNINSWLSPGTPINAATGVWNRMAAVYNGTNRELFIDGLSRATQSGITARDADFDALSIGIDDTSLAESFDGDVAFAYVRLGVLSADWLAAEHSMISNPAGFYTITEL
jgi:hypothetical protein